MIFPVLLLLLLVQTLPISFPHFSAILYVFPSEMRGVTQLTAIGFTPRELCPPLHVLSAIVIALKTFHFPVCVLFRRCFSFSFLFFLHFQLSPLFNGVIQIVGATTTKREKKENKQKRIYKRRGESAQCLV
jgi:hypothetical protein